LAPSTPYPLPLHDALPIFHMATPLHFFKSVTKRAVFFYFSKGRSDAFLFALRNTRGGILAPNSWCRVYPVSGSDSRFGTAAACADRKSTRLNSSHEWISYA